VRFYSSLDIAKTGYKLLRTFWVWEITGLLPWPLLSSYTSLIQVLSRLSLEIVKFYFSRWTSFPGNSAEIWHKVLIPLCRWFIENPRGSWPLLALVWFPPSWWLTRNPRGLFDPFGISLDPPFLEGLLETHVALLAPFLWLYNIACYSFFWTVFDINCHRRYCDF
jgi:hypothetical protein